MKKEITSTKTLNDIKLILDLLTPEQLEQTAIIFNADDEVGDAVEDIGVSKEDLYFEGSYLIGNMQAVKEHFDEQNTNKENWEACKEDYLQQFNWVPKGSVSFHINLP